MPRTNFEFELTYPPQKQTDDPMELAMQARELEYAKRAAHGLVERCVKELREHDRPAHREEFEQRFEAIRKQAYEAGHRDGVVEERAKQATTPTYTKIHRDKRGKIIGSEQVGDGKSTLKRLIRDKRGKLLGTEALG